MKKCNSTLTIVAFIIIPGNTNNFNVETFRRQAIYNQIRESISEISSKIEERLLGNLLRGHSLTKDLLHSEDIVKLKHHSLNLQTNILPPIVTHNIIDSHQDVILNELRRSELINKFDDRVKIVYHPEFLNVNNPIISMNYDDFVCGCDLGVFPSYYEPWGYTPPECISMAVPAVTTNLSGFGCFIEETLKCPSDHGVFVVNRRNQSLEDSIGQLQDFILSYIQKSSKARYMLRLRTEKITSLFDWNKLVVEYLKAQKLALMMRNHI